MPGIFGDEALQMSPLDGRRTFRSTRFKSQEDTERPV